MNPITEFLSGLTLVQYILLYAGCFVLAMLCAVISKKTKLKAAGVIMPVFALLGGMLAVGYVTINLELDIGLGILLVLAAFVSVIIFPALLLATKLESRKAPEKSPAELCTELGHDWQATDNSCTTRCSRCGKTKVNHQFEMIPGKCEHKCVSCGYTEAVSHKWEGCRCSRCGEKRDTGHITSGGKFSVSGGKISYICDICGEITESKDLTACSKKVILSVLDSPDFKGDIPDFFCRYLGTKDSKTFSRGAARAVLERLSFDQVADLIKNNRISGQSRNTLASIADDALLERLTGIEDMSYIVTNETRKRANQAKEKQEKEFCPDGTPHEFGEETTERVDMGPRGDDDLTAHQFSEFRCRVCGKCGYKLRL